MDSDLISIIVPVYNAQAYIEQCIRSVLSQSFREIELILINDGSTDDSLRICRSWEDDPRVVLLSTPNHGVSYARNLGLQRASGKWVLFLDSDDYLLEGCLERMMTLVSPDTQEVLAAYISGDIWDARILHEALLADRVHKMTLDSINQQLLPDFYEVRPLSLSACWAKLYRNDIIRKHAIRFHEDLRLSEDTLFNLEYLACVDQVVVTNLPLVHYRTNASSVTKVFNPDHLSNRLRFFRILEERKDPDAAVHILSLLLFDICKLERYAKRGTRKQLEQTVMDYLGSNPALLHIAANRSLSSGRWQKAAYRAAAACFRHKLYGPGFALLRIYALLTQGEINRITANP